MNRFVFAFVGAVGMLGFAGAAQAQHYYPQTHYDYVPHTTTHLDHVQHGNHYDLVPHTTTHYDAIPHTTYRPAVRFSYQPTYQQNYQSYRPSYNSYRTVPRVQTHIDIVPHGSHYHAVPHTTRTYRRF
jgi:hypothetical protein